MLASKKTAEHTRILVAHVAHVILTNSKISDEALNVLDGLERKQKMALKNLAKKTPMEIVTLLSDMNAYLKEFVIVDTEFKRKNKQQPQKIPIAAPGVLERVGIVPVSVTAGPYTRRYRENAEYSKWQYLFLLSVVLGFAYIVWQLPEYQVPAESTASFAASEIEVNFPLTVCVAPDVPPLPLEPSITINVPVMRESLSFGDLIEQMRQEYGMVSSRLASVTIDLHGLVPDEYQPAAHAITAFLGTFLFGVYVGRLRQKIKPENVVVKDELLQISEQIGVKEETGITLLQTTESGRNFSMAIDVLSTEIARKLNNTNRPIEDVQNTLFRDIKQLRKLLEDIIIPVIMHVGYMQGSLEGQIAGLTIDLKNEVAELYKATNTFGKTTEETAADLQNVRTLLGDQHAKVAFIDAKVSMIERKIDLLLKTKQLGNLESFAADLDDIAKARLGAFQRAFNYAGGTTIAQSRPTWNDRMLETLRAPKQ